jgi:hypothetical protein
MTTTITIIAMLIIFATLFVLQDTISDALSGGKSFMPSEMKGYKNYNKGCFQSKKQATLPIHVSNRLINVLIDTIRCMLALYIVISLFRFFVNCLVYKI